MLQRVFAFLRAAGLFLLRHVVIYVPASATLVALDLLDVWDLSGGALSDVNRPDLFGNVIAAASFLLTVLLALLAVVTSMDDRAIIKRMKDDGMYAPLINAIVAPLFGLLVLVVGSIFCLIIPQSEAQSLPVTIVALSAVGTCITGVLQAGYLAVLLSRILLFRERRPTITPAEMPPNPQRVEKGEQARSALDTTSPILSV